MQNYPSRKKANELLIKRNKALQPSKIPKQCNTIADDGATDKSKGSPVNMMPSSSCKGRTNSNQRGNRKKNFKTIQAAVTVDKNVSRNSEASAGSKSFNRKSKLKKSSQTLATGWTKIAVINQGQNCETMYQQVESNSRRLAAQTQIPLISRQLITNTTNNNTNSRIENCNTPTNGNTVLFDRSNNQRKIK